MKVLIADFDLFTKVGGGQTFYRSIIKKNPNIDFYYLIKDELPEIIRPQNAHPVPYREEITALDLRGFYDVSPPQWIHRNFVMATNIAASVANQKFDIVEFADYEQWGCFLRPALYHFQVEFNRIVLCMHGRISTTILLDWFNPEYQNVPLDIMEELQYKAADIRYGYSKDYIDELKQEYGVGAEYFNPIHFFDFPSLNKYYPAEHSPILNFIGRTEKRKGPDLFVNLLCLLSQEDYYQANIFGPDSFNNDGSERSSDFLASMIQKRKLNIDYGKVLNRDELAKVFASKSVTFLPSRYDTLNLLALESLFSGCPTVVGNGAGVCRFLKEEFPALPFVMMDVNSPYDCFSEILDIISNYYTYRKSLQDAISSTVFQTEDKTLNSIYESPAQSDQESQYLSDLWYSQLMNVLATRSLNFSISFPVKRWLISQAKHQVKPLLKNIKEAVTSTASKLAKPLKETENAQTFKSFYLLDAYRYCSALPEFSAVELGKKLENYWELGGGKEVNSLGVRQKIKRGYRFDRVRQWRELARIEEMRGNDLVAATYKIRALRLLGEDKFGDLNSILKIICDQGFKKEAQAIEAMYGNPEKKEERCFELIQQSYLDHLSCQDTDYEFVVDHRKKSSYKVSIIVSLYNAAPKLTLFLKALKSQTMLVQGEAELILIDSGSPDDEYTIFQQLASDIGFCVVYARSRHRETIQSAWNRGILLSRSPYLTFLGVDETIVPKCLEILAEELDSDSQVDWVTGNSLVTNVDNHGNWVSDVMLYDRSGYHQDLVYLETCYLSWVGSLYRKSIHERFGYYDASFRATGDNEFKNRVLPHIKSKAITKNLGIFWNYPDDRTTQSPLAEIEDMRAWYLYRTLAGVRYAFQHRSIQEVENLLYDCLAYRKSYCQHTSTDIDHAYNLALYLQEIAPESPALKYFNGIKLLLETYRRLEFVPKISRFSSISLMFESRKIVDQVEHEHQSFDQNHHQNIPQYKIFNDNRYEQHSFLWFTEIQ
jgi:glycosyltransferase involved in cell wall biosynthesis